MRWRASRSIFSSKFQISFLTQINLNRTLRHCSIRHSFFKFTSLPPWMAHQCMVMSAFSTTQWRSHFDEVEMTSSTLGDYIRGVYCTMQICLFVRYLFEVSKIKILVRTSLRKNPFTPYMIKNSICKFGKCFKLHRTKIKRWYYVWNRLERFGIHFAMWYFSRCNEFHWMVT